MFRGGRWWWGEFWSFGSCSIWFAWGGLEGKRKLRLSSSFMRTLNLKEYNANNIKMKLKKRCVR